MSDEFPSKSHQFKAGGLWSGNKGGRPALNRPVRAWLDAKTKPALKKLWKLTDHPDPFIALPALIAFLKKCIPDMKPAEAAKVTAAVSEASDVTVEAATRLANLHKKLEAQIEALGREPH